jgi:hypothetical protein
MTLKHATKPGPKPFWVKLLVPVLAFVSDPNEINPLPYAVKDRVCQILEGILPFS